MYLQYVTTLSKTYCQMFAKIEDKRNRLEKVLHKLENIAGQVDELQQELSDLQPRWVFMFKISTVQGDWDETLAHKYYLYINGVIFTQHKMP